jgi:tetraacyldisaccharide 4'-kinase
MLRELAEWTWYTPSPAAALARASLMPLSWLFGAGVARRNAAFDAEGPANSLQAALLPPALSVGNLTVGGTGKTPVASWFAARLEALGARPALVLRGYGDDEWRVHQLLTPTVPVLINPDRRTAMAEASAAGRDCVVLDDAFQHRRAPRVADVVLISADRSDETPRLLPAGPYREPFSALRRATAVVVTVKRAGAAQVATVLETIRRAAPALPVAVVRLVPDEVRAVGSAGTNDGKSGALAAFEGTKAATWLSGRRVLLVSAIADPAAFEAQVVALGAVVLRHVRHPDHHAFTPRDVAFLAGETASAPSEVDGVICTLKDAVKLGPLWPRAASPLWYVSQTLVIERGAEILEEQCRRVLAARRITNPTAD